MLVDFDTLSLDSKLWVYPSSRLFSLDEKERLKNTIEAFLLDWSAHSQPLLGSYKIPYDHFIIIAADESKNKVSGCSIDASVHLIQQIQKDFDIMLLDKLNVTFRQGQQITYMSLTDFKKLTKNKSVSKNNIVFNNLVNTKREFLTDWEVPASESWHNRFFK